jgi:hypothetical protein
MPLRDHFRPPVEKRHSWDELHGMWPAVIVQKLFAHLPDGFVAAPGVHLGTAFEIDVSAYEQDEPVEAPMPSVGGGVAVAHHAPPQPTLTLETELPDQDEYEVRIYDLCGHDSRPKAPRPAVVAGELVLPDAHRETVTDTSDLAGRRFEHRPGVGIQLQGNLPLPAHLLTAVPGRVAPLLKLAPKWRGFLARVIREEDLKVLHAHEHTGRPLGEEAFLATLEQKLGRILRRQKPGPKGRPPS